jgi:hypothetical protein
MRRKFAILFATALVSVSGATACGGIQEDLQKRAQEEVEKGRQQVEQKVQWPDPVLCTRCYESVSTDSNSSGLSAFSTFLSRSVATANSSGVR